MISRSNQVEETDQNGFHVLYICSAARNGRSVYLSRRSSGRSQYESVNGWLHYYNNALPLLERHIASDSLLKMRYEDLVSDPEKTGHILCDFVGIPFESQVIDLYRFARHLVAGNDTRFFPDKGHDLMSVGELIFMERSWISLNVSVVA